MNNQQQQQPNTSQSNVYYVVDGSRKRRQIESESTQRQAPDFSKRPPKPANGEGEILSSGQDRQQISKFRQQMNYVANAVIKDSPPAAAVKQMIMSPEFANRNQRYEISVDEIIDDDTITEEEYVYDSATTSTTNSTQIHQQHQQHQQQQQRPYYVVVNAPERQQIITTIDPSTCTDITTLQESLNHANHCLIDLLEQQRKLKHQNSILRARYNAELNRTDDFQRILLERNLRMKQIVSENVRWNVRYTRIKQHFGDEDVTRALGELAPK